MHKKESRKKYKYLSSLNDVVKIFYQELKKMLKNNLEEVIFFLFIKHLDLILKIRKRFNHSSFALFVVEDYGLTKFFICISQRLDK